MQKALVVPVLLIAMCASHASWSADPLVQEVLEDMGYNEISPNELTAVVDAHLYVVSKRLSRSGSLMLKREKVIDGFPAPTPDNFSQVVTVLDDRGWPVSMVIPVSKEHLERLKTKHVQYQLVDALEAYAEGMLLVSSVIDDGMVNSVFGNSGLSAIPGSATGSSHNIRPTRSADKLADSDHMCRLIKSSDDIADQRRIGLGTGGDTFGKGFSIYNFLLGPSCMLEAVAARMNQTLDEDPVLAARSDNDLRNALIAKVIYEGAIQMGASRVGVYSWKDSFFDPAASSPRNAHEPVVVHASLHQDEDRFQQSAQPMLQPAVFYYDEEPRFRRVSSKEPAGLVASGSGPRFQQVGEDGMVTALRKITVHIDLEHFVRRKIRIEGIMTKDGETRDFFLENEYDDFRYVDNTVLYEPYKETQRMGGILGPEERAQMQEAKQKLDEFERQMAAMPASQRRMMENMMGSQMDQFRQLANDGTVEIVVITKEIEINPDLGIGRGGGIIPAAQPEPTQTNLVQIIQGHLVTLGYKPGVTDGELTRQTVVAITQYEAASGMPVTGKATPQLAGRLAAAVDAL